MRRRFPAIAVLAVACAVAAVAAPTQATSLHQTQWDVYLSGKQTVTWSFAAERPEECTAYYGTSSEAARGAGSIRMTFETPKKKPLWAETYLSGKKLRFLSFSTDGWSLPATWTKQGAFSVSQGKPCGSAADDPEPLPKIADNTGCGTRKLKLNPSLDWSKGDLTVLGSLTPYPSLITCPGVFEQAMQADSEVDCPPRDKADGSSGTQLQEIPIPAPVSEFTAGKKFTAETNYKYLCEYPSSWPGKPPLKVTIANSYEVVFKPRGR